MLSKLLWLPSGHVGDVGDEDDDDGVGDDGSDDNDDNDDDDDSEVIMLKMVLSNYYKKGGR